MSSITKLQLCNRVARKIKTKPASEVKKTFETIMDEIMSIMSEGRRIEIRGFGCFSAKLRRKRLGRNPRTGEKVDIPAYIAPDFKFSKDAQKIFDKKLAKGRKKVKSNPPEPPKTETKKPKKNPPETEKIPIKIVEENPAQSAENFSP